MLGKADWYNNMAMLSKITTLTLKKKMIFFRYFDLFDSIIKRDGELECLHSIYNNFTLCL